ncbi:hypothetical protein LPJ81_001383, partial [Coemansia sp. IMI 209127]
LPDPMSAFVTDGYSRDLSPRDLAVPKDSPTRIHRAYDAQHRAIEEPEHVDSASAFGDSQNALGGNNGVGAVNDLASHPHYSPDDAHEYTDGYALHHREQPYHQCAHSDNERSPPSSQGSRKQRLRQIFGKDTVVNEH